MRVELEVRVGRAALDAIVAHAREAAPAECCGLLLGGQAGVLEAVRDMSDWNNRNRLPEYEIDRSVEFACRTS